MFYRLEHDIVPCGAAQSVVGEGLVAAEVFGVRCPAAFAVAELVAAVCPLAFDSADVFGVHCPVTIGHVEIVAADWTVPYIHSLHTFINFSNTAKVYRLA